MATHSNVLAWRIPGMGEPGGLSSMALHRVRHDWSNLAAAAATTERMKQFGQSGNDAQLWMCLVVKIKSSAVRNNIL